MALDTQDMEGDTGSGKLADFSPLTNYRYLPPFYLYFLMFSYITYASKLLEKDLYFTLFCRIERKYGTFSRLDACTFVVNVYDNGSILSIVTDSSPHGTHVAGITAAYHPEVHYTDWFPCL